MNSNPENKNSYSLLPLQSHLLEATADNHRQSYLPAINKLQIKILRKRVFVKSIIDSYQNLRMMLFGLLMEAYTHKPYLLNSLKRVIYGGSQSGDSDFKDSKLVKSINEVPFNHGIATEHAVMEMFVDVTDVQIVTAFLDIFSKQGKGYERLSQCKSLIQDKFGVEIHILQLGEHLSSGICFYQENGAILKESLQDIDSLEGVSLASDMYTPTSSLYNTSSGNKRKFNDVMDLSITKHNIGGNSEQHHVHFRLEIQDENQLQAPNRKHSHHSRHSHHSHHCHHSHHSCVKQQRKQSFSLWDYLCC